MKTGLYLSCLFCKDLSIARTTPVLLAVFKTSQKPEASILFVCFMHEIGATQVRVIELAVAQKTCLLSL